MAFAAMGRAAIPVRAVLRPIRARQMVNAGLYSLATTLETIVPLRVFIHAGKMAFVMVLVDARPIQMPQYAGPLFASAVILVMCQFVREEAAWCLHPWTANSTRVAQRNAWIPA